MPGKPPAVSVVMPLYNQAPWVDEAVSSVLDQTYPDFELIVVDDGSTDDSQAVLRRRTDARLVLVARPHGGVAAASNTGLAQARGPLVARIGADDRWHPEFLAVQVSRLESERTSGLVYSRAQAMEPDGRLLPETWGYPLRFPGDAFCSLLLDDCTCDITVVVRHELVRQVGGYDESLPANVDWDLWLRVARLAQFAFTDRVLASFRLHPHSLTSPHSPRLAEKIRSRQRVLDKAFAAGDLPEGAERLRPRAYRNLHTDAGLLWLAAGSPRAALASFGAALRSGDNPVLTAGRIAGLLVTTKARRFAAVRWCLREQSRLRQRWRQ